MLQSRITLSLQAALVLFALAILHMTGSVLESLGVISDLFAVVGAVQVGRFFINEELRYEITAYAEEILNFDDLSASIMDLVDKFNGVEYEDVEEEIFNAFESGMFIDNNSLEDNTMIETVEDDKEDLDI